ncbi:MAG: glycosyltransferase family 39 protein [Chlorobiota bacterium]
MLKSKSMNIYGYLIISAVLLLPTIAFPISSDMSVFMHGGSIIADGGVLFKDFFDIKPPLIYYIFSLIDLLFGNNVIAFRLFDFAYQITFLAICISLFQKLKIKDTIIKAYILLFPIAYTVLNYRDTFQTETLAFLPLVLYFYYLVNNEKNKYNRYLPLYLGLALGVLISLKYTLGIVFLVCIYSEYSNGFSLKSIQRLAYQLFVAFSILFLSLAPTIFGEGLEGFIATNSYLSEYAKYPPWGAGLLKSILKKLASFTGEIISISFVFFAALALLKTKIDRRVIKYTALTLAILFLSVLIEKKINMYHLSRFYPLLILLVSYGVYYFISNFKFKKELVSLFFIVVFIFFSPFLRLVNTYKIAYNRVANFDSYVEYYTRPGSFNLLGHHLELADYVNNTGSENFLFLNTGGNQTIHYLDRDYKYKFPHSAFHLSPIAPKQYTDSFEEDLYDANTLAIDSKDSIYMIFLRDGSSYDIMNEKYRHYIEDNFLLDTVILDRYHIYRRNR